MKNFLLANNKSIYYAKQIDLVDYINAFRNLKFSINKNLVTNNSKFDIFIKINNVVYSVLAGTTLNLNY